MRRLLLLTLAALVAVPALADSRVQPQELAYTQLPDPRQEAQAKTLTPNLFGRMETDGPGARPQAQRANTLR